MPTIDCALNSAPAGECEDRKTGFIVALVFFWSVAKSILKSHFRKDPPSETSPHEVQEQKRDQ